MSDNKVPFHKHCSAIICLLNQGSRLEQFCLVSKVITKEEYKGTEFIPPPRDLYTIESSQFDSEEALLKVVYMFDWLLRYKAPNDKNKNDEVFEFWANLKNRPHIKEALDFMGYRPYSPEKPTEAGKYEVRRKAYNGGNDILHVWEHKTDAGVFLVCDVEEDGDMKLSELHDDFEWRKALE